MYYVALGDSLAQGVQPATPPLPPGVTLGQSIETDAGYANDLYAHYKRAFGGALTLVKLGCPGETSTSMLTGAGFPCTYPQGSQLAAALAFVTAHRSQVKLITIDIGANDIDGCVSSTGISTSCVTTGFDAVGHNLPLILGALRKAAGRGTVIAGMNLYDPFLAEYLTGAAGQEVATESVSTRPVVQPAARPELPGLRRGDGRRAGHVRHDRLHHHRPARGRGHRAAQRGADLRVDLDVRPLPVGPNIHANATGYRHIAAAFERAIGSLGRRQE